MAVRGAWDVAERSSSIPLAAVALQSGVSVNECAFRARGKNLLRCTSPRRAGHSAMPFASRIGSDEPWCVIYRQADEVSETLSFRRADKVQSFDSPAPSSPKPTATMLGGVGHLESLYDSSMLDSSFK